MSQHHLQPLKDKISEVQGCCIRKYAFGISYCQLSLDFVFEKRKFLVLAPGASVDDSAGVLCILVGRPM